MLRKHDLKCSTENSKFFKDVRCNAKKLENSGVSYGISLKIEIHFMFMEMPTQILQNAIAHFTKCHLKVRCISSIFEVHFEIFELPFHMSMI